MTALPKFDPAKPVVVKPRLSVRSAAKFVQLPATEQMRLLHDQKFPKQTPQVFMQPYYAPPINGIRGFLERGVAALPDARAQLQSIKIASRRMHCTRVLESFVQSEHAKRDLKPQPTPRYYIDLNGLELRLAPDLVALDGDELRYIYFNANAHEQDPKTARLQLEFAYWLLRESGVDVLPRQVELIDLFSGKLFLGKKPRKASLRDLADNARIIVTLWETIEP
ncbi:hypothetical protein [Pseudoxanthomonas kalamensis]|uniref:hypothetical protein n=1 Tax=Pseudoxanthomonas kalamensis TaxID=289483 RepID=UPI001391C826|nr:hypothetical protein [Pseudoxanthomonas kalamensis]